MTLEQQQKVLTRIVGKLEETLLKKGDDYATEDDRLSNFKVAGAICRISPERQCLSAIATKVARLGVLLDSKKAPKNESIKDSVYDLAGYTFLLAMLISETELCQK